MGSNINMPKTALIEDMYISDDIEKTSDGEDAVLIFSLWRSQQSRGYHSDFLHISVKTWICEAVDPATWRVLKYKGMTYTRLRRNAQNYSGKRIAIIEAQWAAKFSKTDNMHKGSDLERSRYMMKIKGVLAA